MKKVVLLFALVIFSFSSFAQGDYGGSGAFGRVINGDGWFNPEGSNISDNSNNSGGDGPGKNIFKIGLYEAYNSQINISYERAWTKHLSIGISGLYQLPQPESSSFFSLKNLYGYVTDYVPELQDSIDASFPGLSFHLGDANVNRFYVMPEVRYYFKNAPRGFYAGLYFKYRKYDYSNSFSYIDSNTNTAGSYKLSADMTTASFGFNLGMQTFITKWLCLDLTFFGIQYNSNIGNFALDIDDNNNLITSDIQSGVNEAVGYLNEILPVKDIIRTQEISPNRIAVESRFNAPGIRLPSIRLGFRF